MKNQHINLKNKKTEFFTLSALFVVTFMCATLFSTMFVNASSTSINKKEIEISNLYDRTVKVDYVELKDKEGIKTYSYDGELNVNVETYPSTANVRASSNNSKLKTQAYNKTIKMSAVNMTPGEEAEVTVTVMAGGFESKIVKFKVKSADGSKEHPLTVAAYDDLEKITQTGLNLNYVQSNDITPPKNSDFSPIGEKYSPFRGSYDGNGKTISGFNCSDNVVSNYKGLFGYIGSGGIVKNITMKQATITNKRSSKTYIGLIAAYIDGGEITNCFVSGLAESEVPTNYIGGIAGYSAKSTISNCTVSLRVTAKGANSLAGGIVGYNGMNGKISNCINSGIVTALNTGSSVGGIAGENYGQITDSQCKNEVYSIGSDCITGGIVGLNKAIVKNCSSESKVSGRGENNYIGGIAGKNGSLLSDCARDGETIGIGDGISSGGICGINEFGTISNCVTQGNIDITGKFGYAGGIAGRNYGYVDVRSFSINDIANTIIENCYSKSNVSISGIRSYAGGIAGENLSESKTSNISISGETVIMNCINEGSNISAENAGRITALTRTTGVITGKVYLLISNLSDNYSFEGTLINGNVITKDKAIASRINGEGKSKAELQQLLAELKTDV